MSIDSTSVNAIRVLSADAIQKANSGHPGLPLGAAPAAYELWARHIANTADRQHKIPIMSQSLFTVRLSVERVGTAHNLNQFVGDGRLAGVVVFQAQFAKNLRGVVGSLGHGGHSGTVFRRDGIG